jgi:hypothetical protein
MMANQLFGVSAHDPLTFAGVSVLLVIVSVAACYIRRAVQCASIRCSRCDSNKVWKARRRPTITTRPNFSWRTDFSSWIAR